MSRLIDKPTLGNDVGHERSRYRTATGEEPKALASQTDLIKALRALEPREAAPPGRCPICEGLAVPQDLPEIPVPEGIDRVDAEPFPGGAGVWRSPARRTRPRSS